MGRCQRNKQTYQRVRSGQVQMSDDLYAWLNDQAAALRERRWVSLDCDNLAEELEAMALRHKHELKQHFRNLFGHLLKCVWQPGHRSNSWRASIREARIEIRDLLEDMPSLKNNLPELMAKAYEDGRELACDETGLSLTTFPTENPWILAQLLDTSFLPD